MSQPAVVLTLGGVARLAGADVGSLTLISGLAAYADQNEDGERESHVLKYEEQTNVSEKGDVVLVGLTDTSRIVVHPEPVKASKPKATAKK